MIKLSKKIAVLGCGVSALSFLQACEPSDNVSLTIFEKNPEISHRVKTKLISSNFIDTGANYIATEDPEILDFLKKKVEASEVINIEKWVFPFDKNNFIDLDSEKAKQHNTMKKINFRGGIGRLSDYLLDNVKIKNYNIYFGKKVTNIKENESGTFAIFSEKENLGNFDIIIFSMPAPKFLKILMNSVLLNQKSIDYQELILQNQFKRIYSLVIGFESTQEYEFYALINSEREHAISWLSVENCKKGHINEENLLVLIVQAADWFVKTLKIRGLNDLEIILEIKTQLFSLLPDLKDKKIRFEDLNKWESALPSTKLKGSFIEDLKTKGIFIIGDSMIGKGRIDGAMKTGFDLYKELKNLYVF